MEVGKVVAAEGLGWLKCSLVVGSRKDSIVFVSSSFVVVAVGLARRGSCVAGFDEAGSGFEFVA